MTVRNHCGSVDEGLSMDATSGVTPPFLPTLFVALLLGAASLVCRESDTPAPDPTTSISTTLAPRSATAPVATIAAGMVDEAEAAVTFVPAALAFPRQFPLVLATQVAAAQTATPQTATPQVVAQGPHRPAGPRIATLRRSAAGKTTHVAEPPRGEAPQADPIPHVAKAETSGDVMPDLSPPDFALPFAPAIQTVGRVRDFVGVQGAAARTQVTALGGAVVEFVEALR